MKIRLLDSSCWIEIFADGPKSKLCENYLNDSDEVLVPSLVMFEVYKKIRVQVSEDKALSAIGFLGQNVKLDLDQDTALLAADLSIEYGLAMADSIVLAHARSRGAELVTRDNDFRKVPDVVVLR